MYKGTKCPRDDRKFYCRLKCFTVHMYVFLSFLVIAIFPFSREDFRVVLLRFVDFTYFRINVYCFECFICVCREILSRIYFTLIPSGSYFTGNIIMVQHRCNVYAVNIRRYLWKNPIYAFLCDWNFWVVAFTLYLCLSWYCACHCTGTKINGTTMWAIGLEYIILLSWKSHWRVRHSVQ